MTSRMEVRLDRAMRSSLGTGSGSTVAEMAPALSSRGGLYTGSRALNEARAIPVDRIVPDPDQPRKDFDSESIAELGLSMKRQGQLQPIRLWEDRENGRFVIIVGERRWRAAKMVGLATIDAIVMKQPMSDAEKLTLQLIENCQREDLKPMEQAQAFRALMDRQNWTAEQVATELHISPQTVGRSLALLDLPPGVQSLVEAGSLSPSTAAELRTVPDPAKQEELATSFVQKQISRDQAVAEIREHSTGRRRATQASYVYAVSGGEVVVKGRGVCQNANTKVDALRQALEQAEAEEHRRNFHGDGA